MDERQQTHAQHTPQEHRPKNVIRAHKEAARQGQHGTNARIAVWLTEHVGTMMTAYLFAAIGIGSLVGVFTGNTFLALLFGSLSSYFLQLVLLPILSVGQNVLNEHNELLAQEQYQTTMKSYSDLEAIMTHLSQQDAAITGIEEKVLAILEKLEQPAARKRTKSVQQTDG